MKKPRTFLAPESELGGIASEWWRRRTGKPPTHMIITGDGHIRIGWLEVLPEHTQQEHYREPDGTRYDAGEYSVSIIALVRGQV